MTSGVRRTYEGQANVVSLSEKSTNASTVGDGALGWLGREWEQRAGFKAQAREDASPGYAIHALFNVQLKDCIGTSWLFLRRAWFRKFSVSEN